MLFEGSAPRQAIQPQQNRLDVAGDLNASRPQTVLRLPNGRSVVVETVLLLAGIPLDQETASATTAAAEAARVLPPNASRPALASGHVIPLVAEQAEITKESITTGTVRLNRGTEQFSQTVSIPLTRTTWEIERVPIGQLYPEKPAVRQEGDTTIYPLVEERLVAKREFFLLEEVRVKQVAITTDRSATLDLTRDVLHVDRTSTDTAGSFDLDHRGS